MASFDLNVAEILLEDDGNLAVLYKAALLQVRTGPLTLQTLEFLESSGRLGKMRRRGQRVALVAVLEETAEVTTGALRERQRQAIKTLVLQEGGSIATIIGATGVKGSLLRAAVRMMKLGLPNIAVFGSNVSAAAWLAPRVSDMSVAELVELIDWSRARMRLPLFERTSVRAIKI